MAEKLPKKIRKISEKKIRRQKIESCKSSETRFPEVSCRSEPSSRDERRIYKLYVVPLPLQIASTDTK